MSKTKKSNELRKKIYSGPIAFNPPTSNWTKKVLNFSHNSSLHFGVQPAWSTSTDPKRPGRCPKRNTNLISTTAVVCVTRPKRFANVFAEDKLKVNIKITMRVWSLPAFRMRSESRLVSNSPKTTEHRWNLNHLKHKWKGIVHIYIYFRPYRINCC